MSLTRNKLYLLLGISCVAGYVWVISNSVMQHESNPLGGGVCIFKRITHVPCPSCGATRSVLLLLQGDFAGALYQNPIGLILLTMMAVIPLWLAYDLAFHHNSLYQFYLKTELTLRRRIIAIPLILLVLMNWIWNIYKGV